MHHFDLIQRFLQERQTIQENLAEFKTWLINSLENNFLSQPLSLKRSKLDEQIIHFRQFHAQLRTRRFSFDSNLNTTINHEELFDDNDRKSIKFIEQHFQLLEQRANQYNEQINRLSTCLNEFHLEHGFLIDNYAKNLRLLTEQIEQNDEFDFTSIQYLLTNEQESTIDQKLYTKLVNELLQNENIQDENEILELITQVNEHEKHYKQLQNDLKTILHHRQVIFDQYELTMNHIQQWLITTDQVLNQQLTISICQQLLIEHTQLPVEQLKTFNEQFIAFYSSANLLKVYNQFQSTEERNLTKMTSIIQNQTDKINEDYHRIKQRIVQYIQQLENLQQHIDQYYLSKQIAQDSITKAKSFVNLNENTRLPLDNQQIEDMLQNYQKTFDRLKSMSFTIDDYKTIGFTLIKTGQSYIAVDSIRNEIETIEKSWCECIEFILDGIDYLQLHQEDLREFFQSAKHLLNLLNEKEFYLDRLSYNELNHFQKETEKFYEQIEILNQKAELLLQSSETNSSNENSVEQLVETINHHYDNLMLKITARLNNTPSSTPVKLNEISSSTTIQSIDELHHQIDELDNAMNELSELLVSSTSDVISSQPDKLTEQLIDNAVVQNELEKRQIIFEQLFSNIERLNRMNLHQEDTNTIKDINEKLHILNNHWSIMKQSNDLRQENLLLTQTCANQFWFEYNELSIFLNQISAQLTQIHPCSTSSEHIQHEQERFNELLTKFSNQQSKYQIFIQQHSLQFLIMIPDNEQEIQEIQSYIHQLEQEWNRLEKELTRYQNELTQAMIKSVEFQSKLTNVFTWIDQTSNLCTKTEDKHHLEHIRTIKEDLDEKYLDIIHLKQDYTDIHQQNDTSNEHHLIEIDSKWNQLNDQIQEQKMLIYDVALRQHRTDDVITDITQSLDACTSKFSILMTNTTDTNLDDMKQIEISLAKFRILLNDIQLISYDIEQLKQSDFEDQQSVFIINERWEELLTQTNDKYVFLQNRLEQMKFNHQLFEKISQELNVIDKQIYESTIQTNFSILIQCLEYLEEQIQNKFSNENTELKKRFIEIKQRLVGKHDALRQLKHSIEHFQRLLQKFLELLSENERFLNTRKPIPRRFGFYQLLLNQMDEQKTFQKQLDISKQQFLNLDKLATHLKMISSKSDINQIMNSFTTVQTRWQRLLTRTNERTAELEKVFQETKKIVRPIIADIDRIKSEVHRQTSLCQCSNKYHVQQVAEGRYRFGGSQSLRLVRILRSTVMVRVGGGWTALDEFLVRHDPCRAKGRTNFELYPENYILREGTAQTMTLFKPRFATVRQSNYLLQPQSSTGSTSKSSPTITPIRPAKDKPRRPSSSSMSLIPPPNFSLNSDLSISTDDLSTSPHISSDFETKQSQIPIATSMYTPAASTLSRTSSRDSILSENSFVSTNSVQSRRPSKLPLPIVRRKKPTSTKNS